MNNIIKIEVKPKKGEPGAFWVEIHTVDGSKNRTKWFYGEKIFPYRRVNLSPYVYRTICVLIRSASESFQTVSWQRSCKDKGAIAHQKRSEAAGAC